MDRTSPLYRLIPSRRPCTGSRHDTSRTDGPYRQVFAFGQPRVQTRQNSQFSLLIPHQSRLGTPRTNPSYGIYRCRPAHNRTHPKSRNQCHGPFRQHNSAYRLPHPRRNRHTNTFRTLCVGTIQMLQSFQSTDSRLSCCCNTAVAPHRRKSKTHRSCCTSCSQHHLSLSGKRCLRWNNCHPVLV